MVLVASGRGRRRRFVAALFASVAGDAAHPEVHPRTSTGHTIADQLVIRLFDEEAPSLVRLARLFTDDRNAAEDLVQEAFIRLHRSAARIQDPAKAAPYLRSIVLNLARDHNRRGLMSLRHRGAMHPGIPPAPMEDVVAANVDHQRVIEALRDLAPRQRDCLVLRFYAGLTATEIAAELGISPNSVKTHCRRGLAAMELRLGSAP
jgi:RNA polymerase sigma-70 factor (sigma-E family)